MNTLLHVYDDIPNRLSLPLGSRQERGAVLIVALIFLLILTLLGVTAMRMSSLETLMTGNLQESTKAFEAAESGLNKAFNTSGAFSLSGSVTSSFSFRGGKSGSAAVETKFIQSTQPKRGSGNGTQTVEAANFDQASTGTTTTGAKAIVHQGVQITIPKNQ